MVFLSTLSQGDKNDDLRERRKDRRRKRRRKEWKEECRKGEVRWRETDKTRNRGKDKETGSLCS